MTSGSFWERVTRGAGWTWVDPRHRDALPVDLPATVMSLDSRDRFHAKQGRSTARVVFHSTDGPLPVYLKRHYRHSWRERLGATLDPLGRHSPAAVEWAHLERVRRRGVSVPEVVAVGERIGPWGTLQSFLLIAELTGCLPLHEAIPALAATLDPTAFASKKRALIAAMAAMTANLHGSSLFHKDLYLCHFYLDMDRPDSGPPRLHLIDLHRLGRHRVWPDRWRWKDLGQLLFSTEGVAGIEPRDGLRFWMHYRARLALRRPRWQLRMIRLKAARYRSHNR